MTKSSASDPYFLVKDEIDASLKSLYSKLYDENIDDRIQDINIRSTLKRLRTLADTTQLQIHELKRAVEKSNEDPEKFNLTKEEVQNRLKDTNQYDILVTKYKARLTDLQDAADLSLKASNEKKSARRNSAYPNGDPYGFDDPDSVHDRNQLLMKEQDRDLTDLEGAAKRVGQMGLHLTEELDFQAAMIEDLEVEVTNTQSRLTIAKNMLNKVCLYKVANLEDIMHRTNAFSSAW